MMNQRYRKPCITLCSMILLGIGGLLTSSSIPIRADTTSDAESSDPFYRQLRERKPLPAPNITDRFWMGLWGHPYNFMNGGEEVSGRDLIAHHVDLLFCSGPTWQWCTTQASPDKVLDFYRSRLRRWLDGQCRPFAIKAIPNLSDIARSAETDPKSFKVNLEGVLSTFGKDPLIVGWATAEETPRDQMREYLTAQWAIEDRNPHQPVVAFLGEIGKFNHVYLPSCYEIGVKERKPRAVEEMMRESWRHQPPTVWPILQGFADANKDMPTAAETRLMNHLCLAWGAGSILYFHYGGVFSYGSVGPYRGSARDQTLVDPFGNPTECWSEYERIAPECIRIGATTHAMKLDEKFSAALTTHQSEEGIAYFVLRSPKQSGPNVVLAINTDTAASHTVRLNLKPMLPGKSTRARVFTFPEGTPSTITAEGLVAEARNLGAGDIAGWLIGTAEPRSLHRNMEIGAEQARAARSAGDRALYVNSVRLPSYDIVFAKRWKADTSQAERSVKKAEQAFARGAYTSALDLQAKAETRVQASLAAQKDYATITPLLDETRNLLGGYLDQIRAARIDGRVKDTDPVAQGKGFVPALEGLGRRYADLRSRWVKGETDKLQDDTAQLLKEAQAFSVVDDKVLKPASPPDETPVPAPEGAIKLFDGKDLSGWIHFDGKPATWTPREDYMEVKPGSGDIRTREEYGDYRLHVEFWLPLMADRTSQARANSGVFLQGLYEIQVLDSYNNETYPRGECGAIYSVKAVDVNAARPPEHWQTYHIIYRAPRWDASGKKTENARATVFWNGVRVHDDAEIDRSTFGGTESGSRGPIRLQDHGCLVRYRNIWIVPTDAGRSGRTTHVGN